MAAFNDDDGMTPDQVPRREFLFNLAGGLTTIFLASRGAAFETPVQVDCPIYYFHEVSNRDVFARFVIELLRRGGHPISLSTLGQSLETEENLWPDGKWPFLLTFDDGLLSQKSNALPFLAQWSVPAAFAVMPGFPGDGRHRYMTEADMREIGDLGFELVSHTLHHANLVALRRANQGAWAAEVVESKTCLEDITGRAVEFFCYPFGTYDRDTLDLVSKYYRGGLSTKKGRVQSSNELYVLRREARS